MPATPRAVARKVQRKPRRLPIQLRDHAAKPLHRSPSIPQQIRFRRLHGIRLSLKLG